MSEVIKKARVKHVGYAGQREFCRNNKHTYVEKFKGDPVLMCNYPFPDIHHKKGVCRANTCTDMREIPSEISDMDAENELAKEIAEDDLATQNIGVERTGADHVDSTIMPSPSNE